MACQQSQQHFTYNPTKDQLGEGGFGKVFKAYDNHLDRWVAIKIAKVKTGFRSHSLSLKFGFLFSEQKKTV